MKALEIPVLQKNQKVKDWRKLYTAATSGLKAEEQVAFLPLYVGKNGRDEEEQTIAAVCGDGKTDLSVVLDEFQALVDGAPSRMDVFNDVFELKPKTKDFAGLTHFYFKLVKEGKAADMTFDLIFMRFLNFVKNGRKFYEEKKGSITSNLTEAQALVLFKALQVKLKPDTSVSVKKEVEDDSYAFHVEEDNRLVQSDIPTWAMEMQKELKAIEARVTSSEGQEETEVYWNQKHPQSRSRKTSSTTQCYSCLGYNHIAAQCRTVCTFCNKVGHGEAKCRAKTGQGFKSGNNSRKTL